MKRFDAAFVFVILIAAGISCQITSTVEVMPTPVETDACCLNVQPGLKETLAASEPYVTPSPTATIWDLPTETPLPELGERLLMDLPVFWRVPLPGTPVDLAAGINGMIYAASAPNILTGYDVEGNLLKPFENQGNSISGLTSDLYGSLVIFDAGNGFTILSPDGEPVAANRRAFTSYAAVDPINGNLYLLEAGGISVYTTDTADFVRKIPLDELHNYTGLAFDSQGRLYTLRDFDWSATLLEVDPLGGIELDAIPLDQSGHAEVVARDLAIDGNGNFYFLFSMNVEHLAVHMLDAQGDLVGRFGLLTDNIDNQSEGSFFDPRAIAVSPDGRFIFIADGYDEASFLTAFLVESQ